MPMNMSYDILGLKDMTQKPHTKIKIFVINSNRWICAEFLIFVKKQSQELTRVNPDRNIFSINVELTSTFLLYRGLVHHHHW